MKTTSKVPLQIARLHMTNVRCFDDTVLDFRTNKGVRQRTLLIGNNGHGKSTVLRCIAIGLCPTKEANALVDMLSGPMIRVSKKTTALPEARIEIDLVDPEAPHETYQVVTVIRRDASGQEVLEKLTTPQSFPWQRLFACGYGVNRGTERYVPIAGYALRPSVQSLFSEEPALYDPEAVLRNFKLAQSEGGEGAAHYDHAMRHLKSALRLNPNHAIDITSQQVRVHGPWGAMPFHALGDGYRGTSAWMLDFMGRTLQADIPWKIKNKISGPVGGLLLIDEIDEHLHPDWQRQILDLVSKRFPAVQIVGTTHSPMTIVNCASEEVVTCRLHNTRAQLDTDLGVLQGHTTDQILKGAWFGLEKTMSDETEKLLTGYRQAVERDASEAELFQLRHQIAKQIGPITVTPLDELAIKIAAAYRDQFHKTGDPQKVIQEAVARMRRELAGA